MFLSFCDQAICNTSDQTTDGVPICIPYCAPGTTPTP
jgi:hypothetical protein